MAESEDNILGLALGLGIPAAVGAAVTIGYYLRKYGLFPFPGPAPAPPSPGYDIKTLLDKIDRYTRRHQEIATIQVERTATMNQLRADLVEDRHREEMPLLIGDTRQYSAALAAHLEARIIIPSALDNQGQADQLIDDMYHYIETAETLLKKFLESCNAMENGLRSNDCRLNMAM